MQSLLVVGFNVRPLARSAKKAGYRVLAIDFWGDLDLPQWVDEYIAVLDQQPDERPDRPPIPTANALIEGVQQLLDKHGPVKYIIASGGFDDHPEAWHHLNQLGPLKGNPPKTLIRARDREQTHKLAIKCGAAVPKSFEAITSQQYESAINQLVLPILVKPKHGSGGFHSRVLRTEAETEHYAQRHQFSGAHPILIQELIHGTDVSVSVLGSGTNTATVSINEQLIGLAELCKSRTKAYCGNIVPLEADLEAKSRLASVSEDISNHLGLIGSNGFDYVVDDEGIPYFMEINPRIQATIEAIELVFNNNLVMLHLDACAGRLPKESPEAQAFCARLIVYAKFNCAIPNLSNIPGVVDIPMPGSIAERGDPVCTINHIAGTREMALQGAWEISSTIYQHLQPIPAPLKE